MFSPLAGPSRPSQQVELSKQAKKIKVKEEQGASSQSKAQNPGSEMTLSLNNKDFVVIEPFNTVIVRDRISSNPK